MTKILNLILINIVAATILCSDKKYTDAEFELNNVQAQRIFDLNDADEKVAYKCEPCNREIKDYYRFVMHRHNSKCKFNAKIASKMENINKGACGFCGITLSADALKKHHQNFPSNASRIMIAQPVSAISKHSLSPKLPKLIKDINHPDIHRLVLDAADALDWLNDQKQ